MERTLAAAFLFALSACTAAPAPNAPPAGIVSLNPCTDAILAEVADPAQIVALSSYSSDPAASSMDVDVARRFASVSGSVEEVAALHPDLVIGSTFTPPASVGAMARMGLRFAAFGAANTVADSQAQVRQIAALAGHPARGAALNARIDRALALAAPPPGAAVSAVVWQSGGMVAGKGALISELLVRTGFSNLAAARGLRQADLLPLEEMLAQPPRVLFVAGNARGNEDRLLAHPALRGLTATLRAPLEPALLWCGGPSIPRTVARLAGVRREVALGSTTPPGTTPQPPPLKRRGSQSRDLKAPSSLEEGGQSRDLKAHFSLEEGGHSRDLKAPSSSEEGVGGGGPT